MTTLRNRISRPEHPTLIRCRDLASDLGSNAKTPRGILTALRAASTDARRHLATGCPAVPPATTRTDAQRDVVLALTETQRDARRALNDSKFRRGYVRTLRAALVAPSLAAVTPAWNTARGVASTALVALGARYVPTHTIGLIAGVEQELYAELGLKWRSRGQAVFAAAYETGFRYSPREFRWVGPRKQETTSYAESLNYLRAVGRILPTGELEWSIGDRTGVVPAPRNGRWVVAGHGMIRVSDGGADSQKVSDLASQLISGAMLNGCEILPPDLRTHDSVLEHGTAVACERAIADKRWLSRSALDAERMSGRDARATRLLSRLSLAPVALADARAAGACVPGITSWCSHRGLDPETATIPTRDLARDSSDFAKKIALFSAQKIWAAHRASAQ